MRPLYVVLLLASACLDGSLVPCGSLSCPAGDVCLVDAGRCVSPMQLDLCAGLATDAECAFGGLAGTCEDGACTPVICGNGIVDPGEVCDDGNQGGGDGCNARCSSTESCGNGVADIELGEECDCGSAGAVSPLCKTANSADLAADCDVDCHRRYCGDGIVNTIEQCDGDVDSSVSCGDFGYYAGALSCVSCQVSTQQCSGRCGDGVIDSDRGEFCDQQVRPDNSCLDFGYDEGTLVCGSACAPDLNSCHEFGWQHAHPRRAQVSRLDGAGGHVGVIFADGETWAIDGDTTSQAIGGFDQIAATPNAVLAASTTTFARWTIAQGWISESAPWSSVTLKSMWGSDVEGTFVLDTSGTIYHRDALGTWSSMAGSWSAGAMFCHTRVTPMICDRGGTASTWTGTSWTPFTDFPNVFDAAEDGAGRLWIVDEIGAVTMRSGGQWTVVSTPIGAIDRLVSDEVAPFALVAADGIQGQFSLEARRFHITPQRIRLLAGSSQITSDGRGTLYSETGSSGLFRIERANPWFKDNALQPFGVGFSHPAGGFLTVTEAGNEAYVYDRSGVWRQLPGACLETIVTAEGVIHCLTDTQITEDEKTTSVTGATQLWVGGVTSDSAAVAGDHVFGHRDVGGGAWTIGPSPFTFYELAGVSSVDLYAIAQSDLESVARLMHFNGLSWSTVGTTTIDRRTALVVVEDAVITIVGSDVVVYRPSLGTSSSRPGPAPFAAIAATANDDIFAAIEGYSQDVSALWRWNGSAWSPVRTPAEINSIAGLLCDDDVLELWGASNDAYLATSSYRLERAGTW